MDNRESLTGLKVVVGTWIPLRKYSTPKKSSSEQSDPFGRVKETTVQTDNSSPAKQGNQDGLTNWLSGLLLGSAMVARGEIGLLIIEVVNPNLHSVPSSSSPGFEILFCTKLSYTSLPPDGSPCAS